MTIAYWPKVEVVLIVPAAATGFAHSFATVM